MYKRCLCALNQAYHRLPTEVEVSKHMVKQATKEASFEISKRKLAEGEREKWAKARVRELLSFRQARHCVNPRAAAKEQISKLMSHVD